MREALDSAHGSDESEDVAESDNLRGHVERREIAADGITVATRMGRRAQPYESEQYTLRLKRPGSVGGS